MSNISTITISPDLIQISINLLIMEKYILIFLYIFGFIGSLLNIFIFLQKRLQIKSCSIYFLSNSIIDLCYINSFILMQLMSLFNSKIFSSINSTNLWCKLGNYFYFLLPCLTSTYITFASIDRFCASSAKNILQKLNQLKISYILALIKLFIKYLLRLQDASKTFRNILKRRIIQLVFPGNHRNQPDRSIPIRVLNQLYSSLDIGSEFSTHIRNNPAGILN